MAEPQKLSGVEMMLNSLLKATGFDPSVLKSQIEQTINGFEMATKLLQQRLDQIDARLERLEIHLGISHPQGHINGSGVPEEIPKSAKEN